MRAHITPLTESYEWTFEVDAHVRCIYFFFNEAPTTEIYTSLHTLSLHDALPISRGESPPASRASRSFVLSRAAAFVPSRDRKSTRLNSSHVTTSRMPSSA